MRRKGQVTIFIILGILLLAIVGLLFYFKTITVTETFETEGRPVTVTVPQEFIAIQEYTETCLGSIAEQGLKILGQQGGYISPQNVGTYSVNDPANSDGLNLGSISIPFWHYNSIKNGDPSVSISSLMPALYVEDDPSYSIEAQLSNYIESELDSCLNSYSSFEAQGFDVDVGSKSVITRVWDGHVDFILELPLVISKSGGTGELNSFYADVDVGLKNAYEVASEITAVERDLKFLEHQLLDLINLHSGESFTKFPPMLGASTTKTNFLQWEVSTLIPKLTFLLSSYIPQLRYEGSNNFYRHDFMDSSSTGKLTQNLLDSMILPLNSSNGLDVNFDYLGWTPFLEINGGEKTIKPSSFFFESPFGIVDFEINIHRFHSSYDVSYPVLVSLYDSDSFNGAGYNFIFALESNVRGNYPFDEDYVQSAPIQSSEFSSLACEHNQQISEEVEFKVVDFYTGDPLSGVEVVFTVPGVTSCKKGFTGATGKYINNYSPIHGGIIELKLEGYMDASVVVDTIDFLDEAGVIGTDIGGDGPVIRMFQKRSIPLSVMKKSLKKCVTPKVCNLDTDECDRYANKVCFFNSGAGLLLPEEPTHSFVVNGSMTHLNEYYFMNTESDLSSEESVMVSFERVGGVEEYDEIVEDFSSFTIFNGGGSSELQLIPGEYHVSMLVTDSRDISIPEDTICSSSNSDDCMVMDGIELGEFMTGLVEWSDGHSSLKITSDDLYNSDELLLYVLAQDFNSIPNNFTSFNQVGDEVEVNSLVLSDLAVSGMIVNYSSDQSIRSKLEPEWNSFDLNDTSTSLVDMSPVSEVFGVIEP